MGLIGDQMRRDLARAGYAVGTQRIYWSDARTLVKRFRKVDGEGYEYFIFKGWEAIFRNAKAPDILFEFLHWTEELVPGLKTGDAQRVLLEYGYSIYKVEDNISVKLDRILTKGSAMLFASKKIL